MRIVVPFGFYGAGNIGDEATLHGFAQLLSQTDTRVQVSVGSRNPEHTARVETRFQYFNPSSRDPRRWWAKMRADAHAVIGGTPIMDTQGAWPLSELTPLVRSIDRWKVPLGFIGIGTESLRSDESRRIVAEEIAPRVQLWSVRCDRDCQRLNDYGVALDAITVAADMAWLMQAATPEFGRNFLRIWGVDPGCPLIGVNLVNENSLLDQQPRMVEELAAALDKFIDQMGAQVIFLANDVREDSNFDRAAGNKVIASMKRSHRAILAPNRYLSPQEMMSIIGCCSFTISMRYHFCLFSALQGVPFIAIQRSDKISDLCWDMGWRARVLPPRFAAGEIVEHGLHLKKAASVVNEQLKQSVQIMRGRALRNLIALSALGNSELIVTAEQSLRTGKS